MGGRGASSSKTIKINYKKAVIPKGKTGNYLLNPSNTNNQGKSKLFNSIGYNMKNKSRLEEDLLKGLKDNKAKMQREYNGNKVYQVDMLLGINKKIKFKTIWQEKNNKISFITAMPKERS